VFKNTLFTQTVAAKTGVNENGQLVPYSVQEGLRQTFTPVDGKVDGLHILSGIEVPTPEDDIFTTVAVFSCVTHEEYGSYPLLIVTPIENSSVTVIRLEGYIGRSVVRDCPVRV
jgi:hypothetical protein